MAVYKVPQDVEAEDKLIGPFSFRQFIYLIIVAMAIGIGWFLWTLLPPLAVLPLPIVVFFGALALPLRKDQPMEVYMAAIVSFYLKPRRRLWTPDGTTELVEITAPKTIDIQRAKDLSQDEAERRLSYLANLVDSRGWSVRGVQGAPNTPLASDVYLEAQSAEDILDSNTSVAQAFEQRIEASDARHRQEMIARMHTPQQTTAEPQPPTPPQPTLTNPYNQFVATPAPEPTPAADTPAPTFNPYPTSIHQTVIQPTASATPRSAPQVTPPPRPTSTSVTEVSPDIINLANQHDLSVETLAREANRLQKKQQSSGKFDDEVVISLH